MMAAQILLTLLLVSSHLSVGQGEENVALNKPTEQSTTYLDRYSSYAVDGDKDTRGKVSQTDNTNPQWLTVDLQSTYPIHTVAITNRAFNDYYRLQNFTVEMSYEHPSTLPGFPGETEMSYLCVYVSHIVDKGATEAFRCPMANWARYVRVVKSNQDVSHRSLTIVEFEVFADSDTNVQWTFASMGAVQGRPEFVVATSLEDSAIVCGSRCVWNNECLSFTYDAILKVCRLLHTHTCDADCTTTMYHLLL